MRWYCLMMRKNLTGHVLFYFVLFSSWVPTMYDKYVVHQTSVLHARSRTAKVKNLPVSNPNETFPSLLQKSLLGTGASPQQTATAIFIHRAPPVAIRVLTAFIFGRLLRLPFGDFVLLEDSFHIPDGDLLQLQHG